LGRSETRNRKTLKLKIMEKKQTAVELLEQQLKEGYICPQTKKQCDDECCVSAEDCHIKASIGILSQPKQETLEVKMSKQTAVDTYFGRYKWYRKSVGSFWYKHQFTKDANELTFTAVGTWWARYNQCNRYSEVIEIETYGGNNE
jgi:hypothetical protein